MANFIKTEFTPANIGRRVMWSVIMALLTRGVLWLFGVSLANREFWYWLLIPVFFLAAMMLFAALRQSDDEPKLEGRIESLYVGSAQDFSGAVILMVASVRSLRAPSIVENWSLTVTPPGGEPIAAESHSVPETVGLGNATVKGDPIYEKTAMTPIPKGGMVRGHLFFVLPKVDVDRIRALGTTYRLTFLDYTGRLASAETKWSSVEQASVMHYPGLPKPVIEVVVSPPHQGASS